MPLIAGVDGCPTGWLCITKQTDTGVIGAAIYPTASALIHQAPTPLFMMIDIPIGLPDAGPRACDVQARQFIGQRRNSVFRAPIRPAIGKETRAQASQITYDVDGVRVGCQAWGIYPKIREVDVLLAANPELQNRVNEVHPEVCFRAWQGAELAHSKKDPLGRAERQTLIGAQAFAAVRQQFTVGQAGHDDIADAFAALWTAERRLAGVARTIPANPNPPQDAVGLRMEMWY